MFFYKGYCLHLTLNEYNQDLMILMNTKSYDS